ncbi:MAG TPA: ferritin family protein [Candidatus Ozemobacteraceae bacterium]|nr:ferritin family protein [Candidatus Ozemobacteraceae bacterium]
MASTVRSPLSIVLAGEAGSGIQSIETVLTLAFRLDGFHVFSSKEYISYFIMEDPMNIFEFARQKEAQSEAMYRELAKTAPNPGMRNIFTMLAEGEKRHYETVARMEKAEHAELAECRVLTDARDILAGFRKEKMRFNLTGPQIEVYREAQKSEEASEKFYREKARETKDEGQRKLFLTLAEEEHDHVTILDEIITYIGHPELTLENAEFSRR